MEKRFAGKVASGKPEEMASIIVFLLSDDASYLTCTTVLADAGFIVNSEL